MIHMMTTEFSDDGVGIFFPQTEQCSRSVCVDSLFIAFSLRAGAIDNTNHGIPKKAGIKREARVL